MNIKEERSSQFKLAQMTLVGLIISIVVFIFIPNGNLREILTSNNFKFTSLSLFTLVKRLQKADPYTGKKTGTLIIFHGT